MEKVAMVVTEVTVAAPTTRILLLVASAALVAMAAMVAVSEHVLTQ